ncbi:MAG: Stp1/IreP family PP2C-type Ser/Thr phosphatase [Defluviitaleaceae bacterium]|nr:Stp1/IreP family PP2C-type Ser/Thr phosphatase [Defluviitaleaceae bacterium]
MYVAGITDVGVVREQNQDMIFYKNGWVGPLPNLFVVADGMGGHNAGDVASSRAVEAFCQYIEGYSIAQLVQPTDYLDLLVTAAQKANADVYNASSTNPALHGMGTTFTACVIEGGRAFTVHVGDSRLYKIDSDKITQLTRDHTFVEAMIQAGQLTEEEAKNHPKRHMLTQVLGTKPTVEMDGHVFELAGVESLLLCSDGLSNMIDDEGLKAIIKRDGIVDHRTMTLLDEANARGGTDNISVILIDIGR